MVEGISLASATASITFGDLRAITEAFADNELKADVQQWKSDS
jgi:hypothetical protein